MTLQELFKLAMKRDIEELLEPPSRGFALNIGAGKSIIKGAYNIDKPEWQWPESAYLPYEDNTVRLIHAYHFLEHLSGEDAITMLLEFQRVLMPGGIINFLVPYYSSSMQAQDLTHKSSWNETTFKTLFSNKYYDPNGRTHEWKLKVHVCVIIGIVERNLALLGQLVKEQ
jgi:ubiquinone/menaquinone biosynthesis C-methylase UbiE